MVFFSSFPQIVGDILIFELGAEAFFKPDNRAVLDEIDETDEVAFEADREIQDGRTRAEAVLAQAQASKAAEAAASVNVRVPEPATGAPSRSRQAAPRSGGRRDTMLDAFAKSATRAIGSQFGRQIARGVLGTILGSKK